MRWARVKKLSIMSIWIWDKIVRECPFCAAFALPGFAVFPKNMKNWKSDDPPPHPNPSSAGSIQLTLRVALFFRNLTDEDITISGWGVASFNGPKPGPPSQFLKTTTVKGLVRQECNKMADDFDSKRTVYRDLPHLNEKQGCAGNTPGAACFVSSLRVQVDICSSVYYSSNGHRSEPSYGRSQCTRQAPPNTHTHTHLHQAIQ